MSKVPASLLCEPTAIGACTPEAIQHALQHALQQAMLRLQQAAHATHTNHAPDPKLASRNAE